MSEPITKASRHRQWIPVKNLSIVWAQAQRGFNERHADKIASEFDPDNFDDLIVTSPDGDGIYHVVDGQHRKAAVQKVYGDDEKVPCRVVKASSPARAAEIFIATNTGRKGIKPVELFKVRVTAGEKTEVAIDRIVSWLGYRISGTISSESIRAVGALTNVYRNFGEDVLKETLMTIKAVWKDEPHAVDGPIIEGFAALIAEHRSRIDWKRLRDVCSSKFTPARLFGQAKTYRELHGGTIGASICRVLVTAYDNGLRKGRLGA